MREIPEILDDLRAAYKEAHSVTVRFGRLVQEGRVQSANRMAKDLRTSHAEVLRLLNEAVTATEEEWELLTILKEEAVHRKMVKANEEYWSNARDNFSESDYLSDLRSDGQFLFLLVKIVTLIMMGFTVLMLAKFAKSIWS